MHSLGILSNSWTTHAAKSEQEKKITKCKNYKVSIKGEKSSITYDVFKTEKGAHSFAQKLSNEAFYNEDVEIIIALAQ